MEREKNLIFLSHCILNQNAVVYPLARGKGTYNHVVMEIMKRNIGIVQIPCAEMIHKGIERNPMSKKEYDTNEYRILCKGLAKDLVYTIKNYMENGYNIIGIIGINKSPTCGIRGDMGIFFEELFDILNKYEIEMNYMDVPTSYMEHEENREFMKELRDFLDLAIR
ncbi:MAG: hypothetical protein N4A57_08135 [Anaeromicrobium sp.]|jgi:predicted secreted protein|uniref:CD3072 family TudS-related putative desulfidase n=1 Tax=Anaeromicrobium sp. TaxID=1929132 RepID=UPI0025D1CB34|nr:CD3072 family TudS-related putative desulfidase [Anaeromicrobium sp.]MCT4594220.1 hypothetical protein [Anaeromicrobium sp.]